LTILPLAIFAYHNTDYFIERINSVSIEQAQNRFPATSVNQALRYNIEAYLKMFNFSGDPRPMHNLPNEPMLDPIMGILLIIGLLASIHRRDTWVFFLLLIAAIASGVMTNQYSSPSAGRSIGAI